MSLWEWIGESHNPGSVGDVDGQPPPLVRSRLVSIAGFVAASAALGFWGLKLWQWTGYRHTPKDHLLWFGMAVLGTILYLAVSFFFLPKPDSSNMGWLGGLIDHPFRYSDDVNRFLLVLRILLLPGRLVAAGLANPFRLNLAVAEGTRQRKREERMDADREAEVDEFLRRHGVKSRGGRGAAP